MNTYIKKIISIILVMGFCLITTVPVLAVESIQPTVITAISVQEENDTIDSDNLLVEIVGRGTSIPTRFYDLRGDPYSWTIDGLRNRIYTNYLFKPNPDSGAMRVETNLDRDHPQGPTTYIVNLYTQNGTWVYTSTVNTGSTYYINYSNLDPDTKYYVCWEYDGDTSRTLSGSGWIQWLL